MSQTLQNQLLLAKSMNSIITLSDGAGTTITNGEIVTNDLTGTNLNMTNVDTTNMTLQNLNMTGSFEVPDVNDITTSYGLVSFANYGNSYMAKNLYLSAGYLLPYFPLSTTSYRLGLNSMQYMNSASINTLCWGTNVLRGISGQVNEMPKSVVIGNNGASVPASGSPAAGNMYNNVLIGDNIAKQNTQTKDCVLIGGQLSSSNIYANTNSVVIGANIGTVNNVFAAGYNDSVCIGSNILLRSGANSGIIIGANAFKNSTFAYANGPCVIGYNACLNVLDFNRLTVYGNDSMKNLNSNAFNMAIGPECANTLVSNSYCMCFGAFSDSSNALINSTAFGVSCRVQESNTFKLGGDDAGFSGLGYTRTQDVLISKKNRLLCGSIYTTATVTLTFELPEHIYITTSTTTVVNLPTPASATTGSMNMTNIGARFKIIRAYTGTWNNITINAPSGQTIAFNNSSASTYIFASSETYVELVCCNNGAGNATWAVSSSQQVATGGFSTGLSTNTINPYITANQCDLWTSSTASTINIGNQSTAQIINFSKLNTNSIEPKTVGNNINLFTTTIASLLNLGNSGNIINAYFYLNPTISGITTFSGGITASATQTITFGTNAPTMSGANIGSTTIPNTALQTTVTLNNSTSTFSALKTFTAGITASTTQTITFGTNAPTMSGANISSTSIPNSALQTTVTLDNTPSTISAVKTFTAAPIMSGDSIISGTISQPQISNGYLDLLSDQTITSGIKKFNTAVSQSFQTITTTPTATFSLTGGKDVLLSAAGITGLILPTPSLENIGQTFTLIRSGITVGNSYLISPQVVTDRILLDGVAVTGYATSFSQYSVTVTAIATSGNTWILSNLYNPTGLLLSKAIVPLSSGSSFALPSVNSYTLVTLISMGNGALNAHANTTNYANIAYSTIIGANACNLMTAIPTGLTAIGAETFSAQTTGVIQNTTAIGRKSGALYNQTGNGNTLIGANTDFSSASSFSSSTCIGFNSKITASNQVVLGTSTETTIIPSAIVQYGNSYRPNSVFQTIGASSVNWNTTPPTNYPKYILFSAAGVATTTLTLPALSNASIFEGMEFIFRRTNTAASATTTSVLQVTATGTDVIYGIGAMTTAASVSVLANGAFYGTIVALNKSSGTFTWGYFPS